uniref:RING-type domain-containing protein n=1 Tax=Panagrellus redivivus TaxID=6233 RepID=A0A7E4VJA9_PANRE
MITEKSPIVTVCTICQEKVDLSKANFLMCGHIFHDNCLGSWLNIKKECPTCKQAATSGSKFYDLKLVETSTANVETQTSYFYHSVSSSLELPFMGELCSNDYVGEFQGTDKCTVDGGFENCIVRKHTWQLKVFPGGDTERAKGHISIHLPATTTETKPVTMSGVVRVANTEHQTTFKFDVVNGGVNTIPQFISHHQLQLLHGIVDDTVKIECEATFETRGDQLL